MELETKTGHRASDGKLGDVRKRALLFRILTLLWAFPSFGAAWILCRGGGDWMHGKAVAEILGLIQFEQWIAFGVLGVHLLFLILAIQYSKELR